MGRVPWRRGGSQSSFESHMRKDTPSGFTSHRSDGFLSGFESHREPESTRKSNHINIFDSSLALDIGPVWEKMLRII